MKRRIAIAFILVVAILFFCKDDILVELSIKKISSAATVNEEKKAFEFLVKYIRGYRARILNSKGDAVSLFQNKNRCSPPDFSDFEIIEITFSNGRKYSKRLLYGKNASTILRDR